jgi:hypothetical protein
MKLNKITVCIAIVLGLSSCNKWVDVKPSDRLSEDLLFNTKEGFLKALNGVYVDMASTSSYGENLTCSVLDVMGEYYYLPGTTHAYQPYAVFTYTNASVKQSFENSWQKSYALVLNANVILEKCGTQNPVLTGPYFGIVKGEALALRAMLHLDMLRLFGPIYSEQNKTVVCIPYSTAAEVKISPLLTAEQVMTHITDDLTAALALLKPVDPVITEGVRNGSNPTGSNDLYYRQYRLNYYAVKALLARALLWKGDKQGAYLLAKEIVTEVQAPAKPVFPAVTRAAAVDNTTSPDRMFTSEVFFGLYTINRINTYTKLFAPEQTQSLRLAFNTGNTDRTRINDMYDDQNDYRYKAWEDVGTATGSVLTNQKYKDYPSPPARYMIPLIRLGEVLLIAAECSPTVEEGKGYLNQLRTSRNCVSLSPATPGDLTSFIAREFRREMFGEGQTFFYYKRNALQNIPNEAAPTGVKNMALASYVVPLPDSETSQRGK